MCKGHYSAGIYYVPYMKVISMMELKVILQESKRMFHEAGVKLVQLPYEIDVETKISER